jgi:hypothetical protein
MRNSILQLLAIGPELAAYILALPLPAAHAQFTQTPVSSPNLDLSQLGRVAIGGDFDSISLYTFQGQNENTSTNGSQSLLTRYPDGAFQSLALADADASIAAMCSYIGRDGKFHGVVVGGNFTSLGGVHANSIALWNPENNDIAPLDGLSGPVNALLCDTDSGTVYVGGNFMAGNSTNAMAWTDGWVNLPFAGFNGPVYSIAKNKAGNVVFGGSFSGLGNATTPKNPDQQAINLGGGRITAAGSTSVAGFSDPSNIVCKTGESAGPGNTWLMNDNANGYWQASLGFGINPTMLRLYNTDLEGRGAKSFYFEEMNGGGILNLTYTDPSGQTQSCVRFCPLPEGNTTAQDFHFVNKVGMDTFRVWITDYYGTGAGLNGIELYQDTIFSYAVNDFNEPKCDGSSLASNSSTNPPNVWQRSPNRGQTPADFLTASLTEETQVGPNTNVVFSPNLQQPGNYSVIVYTPGCVLDDSCATRGQVNLTATVTSADAPITTTLYQTNNYDKFDQIYYGYIDTTDGFQPSITLAPVTGQEVPLTVVASRIRFELISSTGGLNGLYEYNPKEASVSTEFSKSAVNSAGSSLEADALIREVVEVDDVLYVGGRFSKSGISNVFSVGADNATSLARGGLDGEVLKMHINGSALFVGGSFQNTVHDSTPGLNNIALYNIEKKEWSALGAGVNDAVFDIIPLQMNVTAEGNETTTFAISGNFTTVNGFNGHDSYNSSGFAIWVPSETNWLHNIPGANSALDGQLTAFTDVPNMQPVYGGMITSQGLDYSDAVELVGSGEPHLQSLDVQLEPVSTASSDDSVNVKRALQDNGDTGNNYTGIYDGFFYKENGLNITILGGSFTSTASNGSTIENLMFINNTNERTVTGVTGLDPDSIFVAMDTYDTMLFAGGAVNGTVNGNTATGLVVYELMAGRFAAPHPPALGGKKVVVNAISVVPQGSDVYVGGDYETAGSLPCGPLCYYDTSALQWQNTGTGLSGVVNAMAWASNTKLIVAGNLSIDGNPTTMVTYDTKAQNFQPYAGASTLPGPVTAISPVNNEFSEFWVSGVASNNQSVYLVKYSSGSWTGASGLGDSTSIRKLQIMPLTSKHDRSALMSDNQVLMILGNINIPNQGNASAVLFNGTTYEPYVLTNMKDGSQGSLSAIFVENPQYFIENKRHRLALGIIVVIGLAIALALTGLIVATGFLLERRRRRIEGYVPITGDKSANVSRLPPEQLFSNLEANKVHAPRI